MDKPKKREGRPTKYDPKFCDMCEDFMAKGYSFEAFAGSIRVCEATVHKWAKEHPEFLKSKELGVAASKKWWESVGLENLVMGKDSKMNQAVWVFAMKNRFGWRDKIDTNISVDTKGASDEEVLKKAEEALELLKKKT